MLREPPRSLHAAVSRAMPGTTARTLARRGDPRQRSRSLLVSPFIVLSLRNAD